MWEKMPKSGIGGKKMYKCKVWTHTGIQHVI